MEGDAPPASAPGNDGSDTAPTPEAAGGSLDVSIDDNTADTSPSAVEDDASAGVTGDETEGDGESASDAEGDSKTEGAGDAEDDDDAESTSDAEGETPAGDASDEKADKSGATKGGAEGAEPDQTASAISALGDLSVSELKAYRRDLDQKAEKLRKRRDELNVGSRTHSQARNDLNASVRELMDKGKELRTQRDEVNVIVVAGRDERRKLAEEASEQREIFRKIKRTRLRGKGPSVGLLKREMQELELKQQTTALSTTKERELLEKMAALQGRINEMDAHLEQDEEVRDAREAHREAQPRHRQAQREMQRIRSKAQEAHERMNKTLDEGYELRRKAHGEQKAFVRCKEEADDVHRRYIDTIREIQKIDKLLAGRRKAAGSMASMAETQASAEELFQQFLSGEKLSTEQLMVIQKAGLL